MKIMVIDDASASRQLIQRCLRQAGRESAVEARSREEALEVLESAVPDLVLLDLRLDNDDSFTLIDHIRSLPRPPVVFGLNGSNRPDISERAEAEGVALVVRKPFQPAFLLSRIDRLADELVAGHDTFPQEHEEADPPRPVPGIPAPADDLDDDFFSQEVAVRNVPNEEPEQAIAVRSEFDQITFDPGAVPEPEPLIAEKRETPVPADPQEEPPRKIDPTPEQGPPATPESKKIQFIEQEPDVLPTPPVEAWRPRIRPPLAGEGYAESTKPDTGPPRDDIVLSNREDDDEDDTESRSVLSLFKQLFKRN